jgi:hypothetical protein
MCVPRKLELIRQIHLDAKHLSHYRRDAVIVQRELHDVVAVRQPALCRISCILH